MDIITHKICTQCGQDKPSSEFHKRNNGTKLQPKCKMCRKRGKVIDKTSPNKKCSKCGNYFPRTREFYWYNSNNIDGFLGYCITCAKVKAQDTYQRTKVDCDRRSIDWQKRNPEKMRVIRKRNRKPDPNGQKIRSKRWRDKHPERVKFYTSERRAKMRNAEGIHTPADTLAQYARQNGKCYWCDKELGAKWHEDHLKPLNRGGSNWPDNIVCSCPHCNMSRGDKLPEEWIPFDN